MTTFTNLSFRFISTSHEDEVGRNPRKFSMKAAWSWHLLSAPRKLVIRMRSSKMRLFWHLVVVLIMHFKTSLILWQSCVKGFNYRHHSAPNVCQKKEKSSRSLNKSALTLQANPLIGIPSFQTSQSGKCISAFEQQSLAGQNQSWLESPICIILWVGDRTIKNKIN